MSSTATAQQPESLQGYVAATRELGVLIQQVSDTTNTYATQRPTIDGTSTTPQLVTSAGNLEELAKAVKTKQFTVTVIGEFSTGKSSMLNVLLGLTRSDRPGKPDGMLPTDIRATTAAITFIEYDDVPSPRVDVQLLNGEEHTNLLPEQLARFGAITHRGKEKHDPSGEVKQITVRCASPLLEQKVRLVDTPGLGSVVAAHRKITAKFVPQSDAILFLMSSTAPITESEKSFLQLVASYTPHFFFVQTKTDLAMHPDKGRDGKIRFQWEETRQQNEKHLRDILSTTRVGANGKDTLLRYFPISAKLAVTPDQDDSDCSHIKGGFDALSAALSVFLAENPGKKRLNNWAKRLENCLIELEQNAISESELLSERIEETKSEQEQATKELADAAELLREKLEKDKEEAWHELKNVLSSKQEKMEEELTLKTNDTIFRFGGAAKMLKPGFSKLVPRPIVDEEKLAELTRILTREAQRQMRQQLEPAITEALRKFTGEAESALREFQNERTGAAAKALARSLRKMPAVEEPPLSINLDDILISEEVERTITEVVRPHDNLTEGAIVGGVGGGLLAGVAMLFGGPLLWIGAALVGAAAGAAVGNEQDKNNKRTETRTVTETVVNVDETLIHRRIEEVVDVLQKTIEEYAGSKMTASLKTALGAVESFEAEVERLEQAQAAARHKSAQERVEWTECMQAHRTKIHQWRTVSLPEWRIRFSLTENEMA